MRAVSVGEAYPVVLCQLEAAAWTCIGHDLGARHSLGIKLVVPRRVERVGPVHSFAVAADLYHLRAARIRPTVRVRRAGNDAADAHRACKPGLPRFGDIVLTHLAGA